MNTLWVLTIVFYSYVGDRPISSVTQEFTSEQRCLNHVQKLQSQQKKNDSYVRVASYACTEK